MKMKAWMIYLIAVAIISSITLLFGEGSGSGLGLEYDLTSIVIETLIIGIIILGIYYLIKSEWKRKKAKKSLR